jgi:hypothetical protein
MNIMCEEPQKTGALSFRSLIPIGWGIERIETVFRQAVLI